MSSDDLTAAIEAATCIEAASTDAAWYAAIEQHGGTVARALLAIAPRVRADTERIENLEAIREAYIKARECVDRVFQADSTRPPALLPDFCQLGSNKFHAVIELAKEYLKVLAERDHLRELIAVGGGDAARAAIRDGLAECAFEEASSGTKVRYLRWLDGADGRGSHDAR